MPPSGVTRRNIRLDSFLQRNTDRTVYERIRACEPCVVTSDTVHRAYMHVVLSDERVYLTEYPPRTLTAAASFRRVRHIELVNDFPAFLSRKDRENCQHIRIVYVTNKPPAKGRDWSRRDRTTGRQVSYTSPTGYPAQRTHSEGRRDEDTPHLYSHTHTSSPGPPPSPSDRSLKTPEGAQVSQAERRFGSVLSRLLRRDAVDAGEDREAELHLYATSQTSTLYLHLQSTWNSFTIRSTLLLDPLYRRKCISSSDAPPGDRRPGISWERTARLFDQLTSELLQVGISMETLYLLLQELNTAAHRNVALRPLFWRSHELCVFLVETLEECLHGAQSLGGLYTADQLLLSTVIVQTLAVMFRETQVEARLKLLSARQGALTCRMLLALICDPYLHLIGSELQVCMSEYLDAACSLLFELLLLGHESSRCFSADNFLSVSWILSVLQPHPHMLSFICHVAQQVVLVLSDPREPSPVQSVLLYQRCRLLLACLQYDNLLAQHLRAHLREEFRYSVKPSCAEEKLPPRYPITLPTVRLVDNIRTLMLHK